jgi:hypothetical protein
MGFAVALVAIPRTGAEASFALTHPAAAKLGGSGQ